MDTLHNPAVWLTDDGWIPYPLFVQMEAAFEGVQAGRTFWALHATALAIALSFDGKQPRVRSKLRRLGKSAFPEIHIEPEIPDDG